MMIEVLRLLADNLDMQPIQNGAQQYHLGKLAAYMFEYISASIPLIMPRWAEPRGIQ